MRIRLRYVRHWVDKKTGRPYARLRLPGQDEISLPGLIGSAEFMAGYHAAMRGEQPAAVVAAVTARTGPGTVNNAVALYLDSTAYLARVPSEDSRKRQAATLKQFRKVVGELRLAEIDGKYIDRVLADAPTPGVARTWLITIRPFFEWAVKQQMIEADPTAGKKVELPKSDGHHTWIEEQIARFQNHYGIGTRERLAFELLICTGQRRSDVIRMGRQHVKDGVLTIKQQKTGVPVSIPVHPQLAAAIAACPSGNMTFLTTGRGTPVSGGEFGRVFRAAVEAAGLPDECVPHGLRKAMCRRLAELGMTPHQIAAVSGHLTLKEVERYTKDFDRKQAAKQSMAALVAAQGKAA